MSRPEVVIDTNVAGAWSFNEPAPEGFSREAGIVKAGLEAGALVGVIPELFWAEFQHICMKKARGDASYAPVARSGVEQAYSELEQLKSLIEVQRVLEDFRPKALQLCLDLSLGSYDAYFLALAEALDLKVWTFDKESFYDRVCAHPSHAHRVVLIRGISALPPL